MRNPISNHVLWIGFLAICIVSFLGNQRYDIGQIVEDLIEIGSHGSARHDLRGTHRLKKMSEYNLIPSQTLRNTAAIDTTIIDLRTIDTSGLDARYTFWKEVAVCGNMVKPPTVGDVNSNGMAELYGAERSGSIESQSPAEIWEIDSTDTFQKKFTYGDSVRLPYGLFDVNGDGTQQVVMIGGTGDVYFARAAEKGELPTLVDGYLNTHRPDENLQLNDPTFGDFDGDGRTDFLFDLAGGDTFITELNAMEGQLDTVFSFHPPDFFTGGFAVGDIDQDGKTDIVEGSINGQVYVIKCEGNKTYAHVWTGEVATYNAYMQMVTHDIDGNGKPEFWVGGDAMYNGVGITRFTCFESDGNNGYVPVHQIDLVGIFSFFADNCFAKDIDGDGKEELFICIDQTVIILKFDGQPNKPHYKIFYLKKNDLADQNSEFYGAALYNVNGKGGDDLLISMDQAVTDDALRIFTRIYRPNFVTYVPPVKANVPQAFTLYQNYPNPFNPATTIQFTIPFELRGTLGTLKVYDIRGREIRTLANEEMTEGEHVLIWDGKDEHGFGVSSGIYLIRLKCGGYEQTIKSTLIK